MADDPVADDPVADDPESPPGPAPRQTPAPPSPGPPSPEVGHALLSAHAHASAGAVGLELTHADDEVAMKPPEKDEPQHEVETAVLPVAMIDLTDPTTTGSLPIVGGPQDDRVDDEISSPFYDQEADLDQAGRDHSSADQAGRDQEADLDQAGRDHSSADQAGADPDLLTAEWAADEFGAGEWADDEEDLDRSRHARQAPGWPKALLAGTASVAAVVALVLVGVWGFGGDPGSSTAAGGGLGGAALVLPSPLAAAPAAASPHASVTPTATAKPAATAPSSPAPTVTAGTATVTVLNETAIRDLGSTVAKTISGVGWHVRRVRDVNARDVVTTVYYDSDQQDQAQRLMATVPTVRRALPRPRWLLRTGGLIVVVARDAA